MPMPIPGAQNWVVDNSKRPPLLSQGPDPRNAQNLPAGMSMGNLGYTRAVQPDELMSTHAATLAAGDNRLIRDARMRGAQAGASRGGINSNLAAATGEQAALGQVAEKHAQEAGAYGNAATQNLESLARQRIAAEGNQAQLEAAGIGAGASMYASDNSLLSARERNELERSLTESGREYQTGERLGTQQYQSGQAQLDRDFTTNRDERQFGYNRQLEQDRFGYSELANDNNYNRTLMGEIATRVFDDPETWDQAQASGMFQLFGRRGSAWAPRQGGSTNLPAPGGN